eukprot:354619-Chlamydomonas_euryale.AAC.7
MQCLYTSCMAHVAAPSRFDSQLCDSAKRVPPLQSNRHTASGTPYYTTIRTVTLQAAHPTACRPQTPCI